MAIFILDDDEARHVGIMARYPGEESVHAYDFEQACRLLKVGHYSVAFFDHDLGDFSGGDERNQERTGYDAIMYLLREIPQERWPQKVIVHSWNAPRAAQMVETLRDAGISVIRQPFQPPVRHNKE